MAKVGILSMQRILNYGSFLQAYGLKGILEELGHEVEFVDYHPGECLVQAEGGKGLVRKISKVIEVLKYRAPLKEKIRFINYKRHYAKKYYPYLGIDENMNYSPELDILIIGSDEVFNCVQNNTNVGFSPELFGVGNKAKKLISYAASFGNTTIEKLETYCVKDKVAEWLRAFDNISVRDNNSREIVANLIEREPQCNIDPVLAYDFVGKCKDIPDMILKEKYMILYGYSGRFSKGECNAIRLFANKRGLKILCIGGVQDSCDEFVDCTPFEVIAYFQNAECVITDTFHGTILSIITNRQFVSFVRESGYGNSEKMNDLLLKMKLENRKLVDINNLQNEMNVLINYQEVNQIINEEREKSYNYLRSNV